jgi:sulfite exporter TauE/SafE
MGCTYFCLAGLLIYSSFKPHPGKCAAEPFRKRLSRLSGGWLPAALGFLTGLNLCPPFLLAFSNAVAAQKLGGSILFFISFFIGTLVYFIPLPFLGLLSRNEVLGKVGKMAAVIVGAYYGYTGIIMVIGGML